MLTLQEISDRFEIQDLVHRYAQIIDAKEFDLLREEVFCEDAFIDYSVFGGSKGDLETTIAFLHKAMQLFPNTQHLNANIQIQLDGDRATGRVMCLNPQEIKLPDQEEHHFIAGLWYVDEYRRTDKGWRIARRVEEKRFVFNAPEFMRRSSELDRVGSALAGADTHRFFERKNEDLSVADLAGIRSTHDRLDDLVDDVRGHDDLELDLRQEVHDVLGATIKFGMALLPAKPLDLAHGQAIDANATERFLHLIQFEGFDDRFDLLHGSTSP